MDVWLFHLLWLTYPRQAKWATLHLPHITSASRVICIMHCSETYKASQFCSASLITPPIAMEGRPSKRTKTTHLTYDISSDMGLDSLSLTSTTRIKPSLPHDVISAIASFIPAMFIPWGCESADYFIFIEYAKTVFAFAQISRLFSEVALNTQALWSRIFVMTSRNDGDDEPVFPWELFIERSRSAPLYIVWDVVRIGQHGIENFALLFNQRRRWKELYVQDDDCFYSAFELSTGSNNMPDLPALEVLAVSEPRASHEDIPDRKSTRLNSSHSGESRMPSSA